MSAKLTPKQQRFVEEYLIDLNASAAAVRAGYSVRNADKIGHELLGKTRVAEAIAEAQAKRAKRLEITADDVVRELAKIAFANMADYMRVGPSGDPVLNFSELTRDQAAALAEVTVEDFLDARGKEVRDVRRIKFKLADKLAALEKIGKHLGMFTDRHEIHGSLTLEQLVMQSLAPAAGDRRPHLAVAVEPEPAAA